MELEFQKSACKYLHSALHEVRNQEQNQEIRLSDGMPDVGRVLASWGQVMLRSKEWNSDSVGFSGGIMVWILYAPEDGSDVRCVESWIPFQMNWDLPPDTREGSLLVQPLLRFVDARSVSARKMMVRAGVSALGEALVPQDTEIFLPGELEEDVQLLRNMYPIRMVKDAGEKTFQLDEDLTFPDACPRAEKLLRYGAQPEITEQRISGRRLIVKGNGNLHVLYRGEGGQLCSWDFDLPFSQLVNLDEDWEEDPQVQIHLCMTGLELSLDDQGHLRLKLGLLLQYAVNCRQMVAVISDAYSPRREVVPRMQELDIPAILESRQENIYGEQTVPQNVSQIVDICFLPDFPRTRRMGNEVELQLPGQFQVLYYGEDGSLQSVSPRWEGIHRMKADEGCRIHTCLVRRNGGQASLSGGQILLKPEITLGIETQAGQSVPMITGLSMGQPEAPDPNRPSLILRRADDLGLWNIAKSTGTTVDAIMEANGLTGEPQLDQMLLIPIN